MEKSDRVLVSNGLADWSTRFARFKTDGMPAGVDAARHFEA